MNEIRLLYVEDESSLSRIVSESLESRGFNVTTVENGEDALTAFKENEFDICVLDIMLPRLDGYSVAKEMTQMRNDFPIIFLTAKTQTKDVLKGFELGGSDYIRKPFSMEELIVRIHNILGRFNGKEGGSDIEQNKRYQFGKFSFDPNRYEISYDSKVIGLSERESSLLHVLCNHMNVPCDRKHILLKIWKDDSYYNSRNLDVYVNKLRKLLSSDPSIEIVTLKGLGYIFKV